MPVEDFGKAILTAEGLHDSNKKYSPLSIVENDGSSYISKIEVPENEDIPITNTTYWQKNAGRLYNYTAYATDSNGTGWTLTYAEGTTIYTATISSNVELDPPTESDFTGATWVRNTGLNGVTVPLLDTLVEGSTDGVENGVVYNEINKIIQISKNKLNPSTVTTGFFVSWVNGLLQSNGLYDASDYIKVQEGLVYYLESTPAGKQNDFIAFYDESKVFISGIQTVSWPVTAPANAKYIRVTVQSGEASDYQFEQSNTPTEYVDYKNIITNELVNNDEYQFFNKLVDIFTTFDISIEDFRKNRIDPSTVTAGFFVNWTNGLLQPNIIYDASDYIEITESLQYFFSSTEVSFTDFIAFYDESKVFISGTQTVSWPVTAPVGAKYIRVTVDTGKADTYQLEQGDSKTVFRPYLSDYEQTVIEIFETEYNKRQVSINIDCLGDSLTFGTGGSDYPSKLQALLGNEYTVNNRGVGGENTLTIAARQGGIPMYIENVTIPGNGTYVTVVPKSLEDDSNVTPLKQGDSDRINPCYVQGVECTLEWTGSIYQIKQNNIGNDRVLPTGKKSIIYTADQKNSAQSDCQIIFAGTNDGDPTGAESVLVNKIKNMVTFPAKRNYIVISSHATGYTNDTLEGLMQDEFGAKYINLREYMVNYGLQDAGLTPDAQDLIDIAAGNCPSQLLTDGVHFTDDGYQLLSEQVYQKIIESGI